MRVRREDIQQELGRQLSTNNKNNDINLNQIIIIIIIITKIVLLLTTITTNDNKQQQ